MTTDDVAAAVIKRLIGKVVIHRLDAYSTNSIYLKFDYGIVNSLRISDHEGKKHCLPDQQGGARNALFRRAAGV